MGVATMGLFKVLFRLKKITFFLIVIYYFLLFISSAQAQYDVCGDYSCTGSETCSSCPADCGPCSSGGGGYEYCGTYCCPGHSSPCSPPYSGFERWCWPECNGGNAEFCYRNPECYSSCDDCRVCGCDLTVPNCPAGLCGRVHCNTDTGGCFSDCFPCPSPNTSPSPSPSGLNCTQQDPAPPSLIAPDDSLIISPPDASYNFSWSAVTDWGRFCCGVTLECTPWGEPCPSDPPGSPGYYYNAGETCNREIRFFINTNQANLFGSYTTLNYNSTSRLVSNLEPNNTYYWAVCSYNSVNVNCSNVRQFTVENITPNPATNGSHQGEIENNQVSFSWDHDGVWGTHVGGNTNRFYLDWREEGQSYNWSSYRCNVNGSGAGTYDTCGPFTFTWGTTYYWTVRTSNNGSDFTDYSPNPNTWVDSAEWSFIANHGSWFQTSGGDIHADGLLSVEIPTDSCVSPCAPYLSLNDVSSGTHGLLSYGTSYNLGDYADDNNMAEGADDWHIQSSRAFPDYTYDNFWLDFLEDDISGSFPGGDISSQASGVYNMTGGVLSGNVSNGEQIILLRNGDITINNNLTVDVGGFLMVVSSGTITISSSLGGSELNPAVQGIFIADSINTGTSGPGDSHLWLAGTFIGWNGVNLQRELNPIENNTEPSETFIFRPDFVINAPSWIKRSTLDWNPAVTP